MGQEPVSGVKYDCLMFDLDDTLYPKSSGIAAECSSNIQEYMVEKLGVEKNKVADLCALLYKYYGTTMAGLKAVGYNFNYDDYHSFVHGRLPYETLQPDPVLRSLLLSLPYRKILFTNSDKTHASRVLERLDLECCFDLVIHFETLNPTEKASPDDVNAGFYNQAAAPTTVSNNEYFDIIRFAGNPDDGLTLPKTPVVCKPFEEAYEKVFKIANIDPLRTLFFDDSVRNLLTAEQLGLHTVLVGTSEIQKGIDYVVESIHNIKEAIPELMTTGDDEDKAEETVPSAQDIAIETPA